MIIAQKLRIFKIPHKLSTMGYAIGIQGKREVIFMDTLALIISVIGCLNWGLVGIFRFDLVAWLFGGSGSLFSRIVYTVVGLAGLWCATFLMRRNKIVEGE